MITKTFVLAAALTAGLALPFAAAPAVAEAPKARGKAEHANDRERHHEVRRGRAACCGHHEQAERKRAKPDKPHDDAHETEEQGDD